ncbi:MAG: molybdopterin-dependent oxidoreductase, partial [Clostridia bacterium]|nr:molybdopterin-dependent oxidoreductase [Clostridia bacterium]
GVFSYDQDVVSSSNVYNVDWMYGNSYDEERMSKVQLGIKPDPANDGVYESWQITVTGEVENEMTFTLSDIIENGPKVTKISKSQCTINPNGGPLIANVQITGVPLSYLLNQASIKDTATMMCVGATGFGKNHYTQQVLSQVNLDECYLVYEINGEPIPYEWGYPVMSWYEGRFANENVKGIGEIIVTTDDPNEFTYNRSRHNNEGIETVSPNLAICNFVDGQIISANDPYTFEGYADAFDHRISAVEFSFDNGATWTTYETPDTTTDRWVYWYFEWTPPASGSYVISARAVDEFGKPCYRIIQKLVNVQ